MNKPTREQVLKMFTTSGPGMRTGRAAANPDELTAALNGFSTDDDARYRANHVRKLADVAETTLKRARKRLPNVVALGGGEYRVNGDPKLGDAMDSYRVDTDDRHCSCFDTIHGDARSRKTCTHIIACWLYEQEHGVAGAQRSDTHTDKQQVNDGALIAWGDEVELAAKGEGAVAAELAKVNSPDPLGGVDIPNREPYTPREWAEWRPPVLGAVQPSWQAMIDMPAWASAFRPWQTDAIEQVIDAFEKGYKFVFVEAPTGAGKTLIAEGVRQLLGRQTLGLDRAARACYVCTTKSLQDQFTHDFPNARVIKGRSNYPTAMFPAQFCPSGKDSRGVYNHSLAANHVSCAECTYKKGSGCDWCSDDRDGDETWRAKLRCPYNRARNEAMRADLSVLNTAYFVGVCNSMIPRENLEAGSKGFADRELVIMDEFDLVESVLMSQVEVVIGKRLMEKWGIEPPALKGERSMGGECAAKCWAPWIRETALPCVEREIEFQRDQRDRGNIAKNQALQRINGMVRLSEQLEDVATDMEHPEGARWVYDGYKEGKVAFKPVMVDKFGDGLLWQHGKRFLCMSATLLDARAYATAIGIPPGELKVVSIPSSFPPQQRPVIIHAVCENSYANRSKAWNLIPTEAAVIVNQNTDMRILVHTVSYGFTERCLEIAKIMGCDANGRTLLTYTDARERENALIRYKETPGAVMFAPSFDRGIDLPDELCRGQIIAKVPFPSLGDKQIEARQWSPGGKKWYAMETIRTLVQMAGRSTRKPVDWSTTWILDALINRLIQEWRSLFPPSFLNAVFPKGYTGMTVEEYEKRKAQGRV